MHFWSVLFSVTIEYVQGCAAANGLFHFIFTHAFR